MFTWAKQTLANVAGTEEPIYGPSAIQTVTEQAKTTPYTELKKEDLKWLQKGGTNVETQTFYFTADNGHYGMAQVIYSVVAGLRKTLQFNTKIFYPDQSKPILWSSDPLEDYTFPDEGLSFKAKGVSITLSPDGTTYTIKSNLNKKSVVDITITRQTPGIVIGKDGTTHYGTDPSKPWGSMMHAFWPRCSVSGTILTQGGPVDFAGKGLYIHALQGMKPHHAAARWNFCNFQSDKYSAVLMEFTTPPSYGTTKVAVGILVADGKVVYAGADNAVAHTGTKQDSENDWPEPTGFEFEWDAGKVAVLEGPYGPRLDRIDVMAEVPGFVKTIVATAAGTKPYIYQYMPKPEITVTRDGQTSKERGVMFSEATFISAV